MAYQTTLVDEVRYADPTDVSVYIRNKDFDASSDPTETEVQNLLLQASERIDNKTGRAWRTRKAEELELEVEFTREQRGVEFRDRKRGSYSHRTSGVFRNAKRRRAMVFLPHIELQEWSPTDGDSLEILTRNGVEDISTEEGRTEDDKFHVDQKGGIIYVDFSEFSTTPLRGGQLQEPSHVRVSYRYGNDESANTDANGGDGLADSVPGDVKQACAKMVAADLMRTDQYGSLITSGPENVPDQTTAAGAMWSGAMDVIEQRARRQIL